MDNHILVQILAKGIKLGDSNLRGYTKTHLKTIGLDKNTLNKGVKLGLIKKVSVVAKETKYEQAFYCVEVATEPGGIPIKEQQSTPTTQETNTENSQVTT